MNVVATEDASNADAAMGDWPTAEVDDVFEAGEKSHRSRSL